MLRWSSSLVLRLRSQRGVVQDVRARSAKKIREHKRTLAALSNRCKHVKHWMKKRAKLLLKYGVIMLACIPSAWDACEHDDSVFEQRSRARQAVWCPRSGLSVSGSRSTATETHEHNAVILNNALTTTLVAVSGLKFRFRRARHGCPTGSLSRHRNAAQRFLRVQFRRRVK
jgi:hypothetical protein